MRGRFYNGPLVDSYGVLVESSLVCLAIAENTGDSPEHPVLEMVYYPGREGQVNVDMRLS